MKNVLPPKKVQLLVMVIAAVIFRPVVAAAHLVTTGMGPVYDGIGHLMLAPEDLIVTLAVALYAGLRGATSGRYALFVFPIAWFIGGLLGMRVDLQFSFPMGALSFLLLGLFIAADLRLPPKAYASVALTIGLAHGFFNGLALKEGPAGLGLIGIMAALFVIVALVAAVVVSVKLPWARVAVRVIGSWVAAIGILMIGWFMHSGMT
jgi:hydrogenase/urease accessory protein HupE